MELDSDNQAEIKTKIVFRIKIFKMLESSIKISRLFIAKKLIRKIK